MSQQYRDYVIDNLFVEDFFEKKNDDSAYVLEETESGGECRLYFKTLSPKSIAILNVDGKKTQENDKKRNLTQFNFLKSDGKLSLRKRVDHIVFEEREDSFWIAHLLEMKSSVSCAEKWTEIKGKFRASYLLVQALCAMLHMKLMEVRMYTSYENVSLSYAPENLVFRKPRVGAVAADLSKEWSGEKFVLQFGDDCRLPFLHTPIHVTRNEKNILEGQFNVDQ